MLLAVRISSYGCTWEVWRALKKLELLSAAPRATLTLLSCSPNFLRVSITRYTHAKHEPIFKCSSYFNFLATLTFCVFKNISTRSQMMSEIREDSYNKRIFQQLIYYINQISNKKFIYSHITSFKMARKLYRTFPDRNGFQHFPTVTI